LYAREYLKTFIFQLLTSPTLKEGETPPRSQELHSFTGEVARRIKTSSDRILAFFGLKTGLFRLGGHILVMPHGREECQHILPTPTSASRNIMGLRSI
jgi:hypothetical protein